MAFYERMFQEKLSKAMKRAETLLVDAIRPVRLDEESHVYDDKFAAAESATALALDAVTEVLGRAFALPEKKADALRFAAVETCTLKGERERDVKGPKVTVQHDAKRGTLFGTSEKNYEATTQVTTKVTEYVWTHELSYEATLVDRVDLTTVKKELFRRTTSRELTTQAKEHSPEPARKEHPAAVLDLSLLASAERRVDRSAAECRTPRRNAQVDAVLALFSGELATFAKAVRAVFQTVKAVEESAGRVFSPAACCFVGKRDDSNVGALPLEARAALLQELTRTLDEESGALRRTTPAKKLLVGADEVELLLCLAVVQSTITDYAAAVAFLETMLRRQLEAAVGKELTAEAFDEYALYHDRLLFHSDFRPIPFSYAVRRSAEAFPDGTLSIVDAADKNPIRTFARDATDATSSFKFAIGAAAYVSFDGPRYAHAYVARTFGGRAPKPLEIRAKARPFSTYVLLLGKVASRDEFLAEHAVVVQASDEVCVPLLLNPLPTPKEFADAIESLSPEQRAFCEAFRQMQLASSLFGVVVVQVKPAVEKVLNLPRGALLKEIALTEHLTELFIDYQIPTDMLSYDGPPDADKQAKIDAVKAHVAAIRSVIQAARDQDLKKTKEDALHRKYEKDMVSEADLCCEDSADGDDDGGLEGFFGDNRRGVQKSIATFGSARGIGNSVKMKKGGFKARERAAVSMAAMPTPRMAPMSLAAGGAPGGGGGMQPPPAPAPQQQQQQPQEEQQQQQREQPVAEEEFEAVECLDLTTIPKKLDANFKALDTDSQLRPTTVKTGDVWNRKRKHSIIAEESTTNLRTEDLAREKSKAFDLLDALSRSGALTLADAELHVVVVATHAFDKSITDTLVVDNVDPILKTERASLIIATTLHDKPALDLVEARKLPSLLKSSPFLLPASVRDQGDESV